MRQYYGRFALTFAFGVITAILCLTYYRIPNTKSWSWSNLKAEITSDIDTDVTEANMSKPVITVGSGLAGLAAAYEALKAGAKVHMLDRAPKPGGNSIKASSGISAAGTKFQKAGAGPTIEDDVALFYEDSVRSAGSRLRTNTGALGEAERRALIEMLTSRSADAIAWLADDVGVDLSLVAQLGGHSAARTHRGAAGPPPGFSIVSALLKKLRSDPGFTLTSSAEVEALTTSDDGRVTGVRYTTTTTVDDDKPDGKAETEKKQTHEISGPVVFAVGGFAGDAHGLLAKYRPDLAGMPSTNEAWPAKRNHELLADVGAEFVDMDSVQIHPTGFVDPADPAATYKFLAAEALRGEGGILLSSADGNRFVNEMERRDVVSAAIMALPRSKAYTDAGTEKGEEEKGEEKDSGIRQWDVTLLLDPGASQAAASHLGFYVSKGLMQKKKVKDLPPAIIRAVDRYAEAVAKGSDDEFGRKAFGHWRLPPGEQNRDQEVCVGRVTPVSHFTMGGVAFNERAQVLKKKKKTEKEKEELEPIDGLWAAGEITGGIHGDNRLGGSSLLECAVFGRIAGSEAAKSLAQG